MGIHFNLEGTAMDHHKRMMAELKRRAVKELGTTDIIVRPLRAEDIGLSTPQFTKAPGGTGWINYVNTVSVADNRFIGINGIHRGYGLTAMSFSQLRFTRSGRTSRIWNIQPIEDFAGNTGFFDDPVLVDQNQSLTIEAYSITNTTDKMVFLGMVAEKRGIEINP